MEIEFKSKDDSATLKNVDPLKAMAFATAFMQALQEEAKAEGKELTFEGLELRPGSVIVVTKPNNEALARHSEKRVRDGLRLGELRRKPHLRRLVQTSEEGDFSIATARHGKKETKFDFRAVLAQEDPHLVELTTLRATFLGITAKNAVARARARFASVLTNETMQLVVEHLDDEAKLTAGFRHEFDIEVELERDLVSQELTGKLLKVEHVKGGDSLRAWRDWFNDVGEGWKDVTPETFALEREDES